MEIVKVTLPIDEDLLIRSFTEDITFEVSVKESSLKNQDLLYYLNNIDIKHILNLDNLTKEELEDLMFAYITLKKSCSEEVLDKYMFDIIMQHKGIDTSKDWEEFNIKHKEEMDKIITFLDSCLLFMLFSIQKDGKFIFQESIKDYEQIEDRNYIGLPVVNFFKNPLIIYYYEKLPEKMYYFKEQFEEPIFSGKTLHNFVLNDNNPLVYFLMLLLDEKNLFENKGQ